MRPNPRHDVPATTFLDYLTKGSAFKNLGFPHGGTIEMWKPLVDAIEARGGEVWLNSKVTALTFGADGLATGADIAGQGSARIGRRSSNILVRHG